MADPSGLTEVGGLTLGRDGWGTKSAVTMGGAAVRVAQNDSVRSGTAGVDVGTARSTCRTMIVHK